MERIAPHTVARLAELARISLSAEESGTIGRDLEAIVGHFEDLEKINTDGIAPMIGAAGTANVMRSDDDDLELPEEAGRIRERITDAFPSRKGDSLEVEKIL